MEPNTTTERHVHTAEELAEAAERLADLPRPELELELTTAGMTDAELGYERVLTLREAAELCGTTYTALRKRADRGGLATVKRGNVRMVPVSELERHGLMPGTEERRLAERVAELERELAKHRLLAERSESALEAERHAHELAVSAVHLHRAEANTARITLEQREETLAEVAEAARGPLGPIRAWLAARNLTTA